MLLTLCSKSDAGNNSTECFLKNLLINAVFLTDAALGIVACQSIIILPVILSAINELWPSKLLAVEVHVMC